MNGSGFLVTFVYGFNMEEERRVLWTDLKAVNTTEPWVILGDFNEILNSKERIGARVKFRKPVDFKDYVEHCHLEDVKYRGNYYTWSNKQQGDNRIYSKIDRVLANQKWLDCYTEAEEKNYGKKPFKFFRMWNQAPDFKKKLASVWSREIQGTAMFQLVSKLKQVKMMLKELNNKDFHDIPSAELRLRLNFQDSQVALQRGPLNKDLIQREKEARDQYVAAKKAYQSFLQQKEKVHWLKEGDENSAFFHASIRERRAQNRIYSITDAYGRWLDQPEQVQEAFLNFYEGLLATKMSNRSRVIKEIVVQGAIVKERQAQMLEANYTEDDVKQAIFSILASKAPGTDGYSSSFLQDNWEIVGKEVSEAILSFLHSGKILKEVNSTVLTLVPKSNCPNLVSDYRPIACCNVIYKAATKMICNRLRLILPDIVAQNQGGFVHRRFIAHNIMVCQDLVRHYGRKHTKANCMIKLDLQKAYDTIEWEFLEEMLAAFHKTRITTRGSNVSPSICVGNGVSLSHHEEIRQKADFKFHERCEGLKLFSRTSGLNPNEAKSVVFCCGMAGQEVQRVLEASGFSRSELPFKYLGIPICAKRISTKDCESILEKMVVRIRIWSTRNLSYAGRITLINSVLVSIHTYWSQIMIIPKKILKSINSICRAFLLKGAWDYMGSGNVAWDTLCKPKSEGGMGFRNIMNWNIAAIGKYIWAVASKKDNLWIKWVHNVYIKDEDWWAYTAPMQSSWYWKKNVAVKEQFKSFIIAGQFTQLDYSIKKGYLLLCPPQTRISWSNEIWGRLNVPKHSVILWLTRLDRLKTMQRLHKIRVIPDSSCLLCRQSEENIEHLFFKCPFSNRFKKQVLATFVAAGVYQVWKTRNEVLWFQQVKRVDLVMLTIIHDVKSRIYSIKPGKVKSQHKTWEDAEKEDQRRRMSQCIVDELRVVEEDN
ncbi:uncharacterized protein LOC133780155 [Humulus lupulus]|uniref:uncharacterized protein LOC133780155 n=1 Tax=Humulus lupulus TaxID=3486 RepID=UPI002B4181CB|nr:uncharacterized protein LOC133780155 [Humulus lupulus]